jgi:hypothetical protein
MKHFNMLAVVGSLIFVSNVHAVEPTCGVQAEILEVNKGKESPIDFKAQKAQNDQKYTRFRIVSKQEIGPHGNCKFVQINEVIEANAGTSPEILKQGALIEAGAGLGPKPRGKGATRTIQWYPVKLVGEQNQITQLQDFYLESPYGKKFKPVEAGPVKMPENRGAGGYTP